MKRRAFTRGALGAGVGFASVLGGCARLPLGEPSFDVTWTSDRFVGQGLEPTVFVTGSVENTGSGNAAEVDLTCRLLDGDGAEIQRRRRTLTDLSPGESQLFYFRFVLTASEVANVAGARVTAALPEG